MSQQRRIWIWIHCFIAQATLTFKTSITWRSPVNSSIASLFRFYLTTHVQGSQIQIWSIDKFPEGNALYVSLNGHCAGITSIGLFPLKETSLYRNAAQIHENVSDLHL